MKVIRLYLLLVIFFFISVCLLIFVGCEAENPGESVPNSLPDTHISGAYPGNITTIYFYGTDKDGFVNDYAYKWNSDIQWSFTKIDSVTFIDAFSNQNEVKTFYVKGIDNRGDEDPSPAEIALSPNNILPTTRIVTGPGFGDETGEDVTFTFTGSDLEEGGSVIAFQYTMDDLTNWQETPVSNPEATFFGLSEGAHTFYVRAVDNLRGADASPAQVAFIVRTDFAPIIENLSPVVNGSGWFAGFPLTFEWSASAAHYYGMLPDTPYSFSYDDSTNFNLNTSLPLASGWVSESSTIYIPTIGLHTFYLKVRDSADNLSLMKIEFEASPIPWDPGVLVVCGIPATVYGSQIIDKINAGVFWGNLNVSFWDIFGTPNNPQPEFTLPMTVTNYMGGGSDGIPPTVLAQFSTIVWLGNNFQGDLDVWNNTQILQYLQAGAGNVILTTRYAADFLPQDLTDYLNIEWREGSTPGVAAGSNIHEYKTIFPGMVDFIDSTSMSAVSVFSGNNFNSGGALTDDNITNWDNIRGFSKDANTTLLFTHRSNAVIGDFSETMGLGVWSHPNFAFSSLTAGNEFPSPSTNESKGNFILISGRCFEFDTQACLQNFEFMLRNMCGEN
jgi:hypothetical protein